MSSKNESLSPQPYHILIDADDAKLQDAEFAKQNASISENMDERLCRSEKSVQKTKMIVE